MHRFYVCLVLVLVFVCTLATTACAVNYELRDLGTFGGICANAYDISNRGEIVGGIEYADIEMIDGVENPRTWCRTFLLDAANNFSYLPAPAVINDKGQIAYENDDGLFLIDGGTTTLLSGPSTRLHSGIGGLNNNGQIIGRSWIWDRTDGYQDLGILDTGNSGASDVNDNGLAVGSSEIEGDNGVNYPFWWQNGNLTVRTDFPGMAAAVSNSGLTVGYIQLGYGLPFRAVSWMGGTMTELPLPEGTIGYCDSEAVAVNEHGLVVGAVVTDHRQAAVWQNGVCTRLPGLGGDLTSACDVNDEGWVVGCAAGPDGIVHAVMWEPVPECSSFLGVICGMLGIASAAIRRRR